ncbi:hypothetical protein LWI29_014253 [Acer saccharum]|uniref:Uncharacterized protein n=1 Tax=Acer saccharum TaxID=4024 RepID=A0AA39TSX2_ACESA|nr:hypothetical protein LWI29_014253 [Acer saccharum]
MRMQSVSEPRLNSAQHNTSPSTQNPDSLDFVFVKSQTRLCVISHGGFRVWIYKNQTFKRVCFSDLKLSKSIPFQGLSQRVSNGWGDEFVF